MHSREWMRWAATVAVTTLVAAGCGKGGNQANNAGAADTGATAMATSPTAPAGATTGAAGAEEVHIPATLPAGVTADMIKQGRDIFTGVGNCYTCHGQDAKGTQLAPDLTDHEYLWVTDDLNSYVQRIDSGVPQPKQHPAPMPPMGGAQLTPDQVHAVAAYEWSLSHP